MRIQVILRTHDGKNVHDDWRVRYCDMSKKQLVMGCYLSLLKTIRHAEDLHGWDIKITVLDDHSTSELIEFLNTSSLGFDYELVNLTEKGYNHSALKQFEACKDSNFDLIYSVEDDYLHCDTAISEMVESYILFKEKLQNSAIVIYPFDAPEEYNPPEERDFIVHGSRRHWRTGRYTTNVLLTTPKLIRHHWPLFEVLAKNYDGNYLRKTKENEVRYTEENTIWNIWRHGQATRFSPIPSLALHMQFDKQLDPFIDWKQWWDKYAKK